MAKEKIVVHHSPICRVSFPHLEEPTSVGTEPPKYRITLLMKKNGPEHKFFQDLVDQALKNRPDKDKSATNYRLPIRDGSEKDYEGYGPDVVFLTMAAEQDKKPGVANRAGKKCESDIIYAGCYARVSFTCYWYNKVGKGVTFGLNNVQFVKDGTRFSGRKDVEEDFDAIPDEVAEELGEGL